MVLYVDYIFIQLYVFRSPSLHLLPPLRDHQVGDAEADEDDDERSDHR